MIYKFWRNDIGWYRCFVNNIKGNDSDMMYLWVKGNIGELFLYFLSEVYLEFVDLFGVGLIGI